MQLPLTQEFVCDQCGVDVGFGELTVCIVVSDLGVDGHVVNRHFCRIPRTGAPHGCAGLLMTDKHLEFAIQVQKELAVALEKGTEAVEEPLKPKKRSRKKTSPSTRQK